MIFEGGRVGKSIRKVMKVAVVVKVQRAIPARFVVKNLHGCTCNGIATQQGRHHDDNLGAQMNMSKKERNNQHFRAWAGTAWKWIYGH